MSGPTDAAAQRRLELERRLAALSPAKRALLERAAAIPRDGASGGIPCRTPGVAVPMSFAQELLWLLHRAAPDMHGYNVPRVVRLRGRLDVDALQSAIERVVARHEVLRTTFELVDGEPRQIIHEPGSVPLERIDLRTMNPDARDDEAVRIVRQLVRRPFDLATDLQLRATLITLGADDNVLVLESHHVASDAWSRNILMREVAAYYAHATTGSGDLPPAPAIQYGDFAIWQRETLRGPALDQALDYWRERLAGAPELLDLPTDRPRTGAPSFEGATRSRMMPVELLAALRDVSRAHGVTLFTTLLTAFDVLLARYSGQDDVIVGSPVAGRAHPDTEGVIGYFANTLVLRARLDGDPTFAGMLERMRECALGAFEHQDVPYEKLVQELQQSRGGSRSGPVQVMFTLQDAELRTLELPGLRSEPFGTSRGAAKFDLALFMHEQPAGLRAAIEYRTDLYDASTIDRMLDHLVRILEQVVARSDVRLSEIELLTRDERELLLESWNDTAAPFDSSATLHELIRAQCLRTPESIALEWESDRGDVERLTFAQLEAHAAALGQRLRELGAQPGVGIGICAPRGPELVIAMLAAMRSGAYYLPLDPEYPADRLAFMLDDARVPVIVGTTEALEVLRSLRDAEHAPRVVSIACRGRELAVEGGHPPSCAVVDGEGRGASADDLAYVIYTSGSTGRPKGVMIPHRAVVNYLTWMARKFAVDGGDAVLQKAPASFDACIWEFFLPLVTGARLVLARPGGHQDPAYLLGALARHSVTLLQLVPSQLRMITEMPGFDDVAGLPRLRRLFLGGEALPPELLQQVLTACPSLEVTNLYGPTEATVYATEWSTNAREWHGGSVPIGSPIANAVIRIVDAAGRLAPIGVAGELCIGGVGLAAGYLNRPELTADRFVADGFAADPAARLYRTGDRARWRPDGSLEYLGRIDGQVKLRGFRVELGEIEGTLAAQPEVTSAVVLVREDTPGDQRLAAYCIPTAASSTRDDIAAALRLRLKSLLPEFMVPSTITWLEAWPMNANGKLDRKALPAPVAVAPRDRVEPRNDVERTVAQIWEDVLGRPVGVLDDFFEIGGHSLLALRVLSRIADRTHVRMPLRVIFDAPTVAELAAHIESGPRRDRSVGPALAGHAAGHAPLTHAQEVLWLVQRTSPESTAYNVAEQWFISGQLDVAGLSRAVAALVRRHDVFRTRFGIRDGAPVQWVGDEPAGALAIVEVPSGTDAGATRIAAELAARPFDLEHDALARFTLIVLAPTEYRLVFVTHHIVFDGWSRGLLVRELSALYAAEQGSGDVPEAPPVRFADFAAWQRGAEGRAGHDAGLAFWRDHLAGAKGALVLPEERAATPIANDGAAKETLELDDALLRGLEGVAARNDATLFMVLFAAFQTVLHRYGDARDVVVATVHAGRTISALESVVGYFANTVAYCSTFDDATTFRDVVRQVRATHLAASEHADLPFEMIADMPDLPPLPRVLFALQNNERASLVLGDASVRPSRVASQGAKFDLFLSVSPTASGLRATLQYRTSLFGAAAARRILGHVASILRAVATDDAQHVAALPLLDPAEHDLVVREWNATARAFDASATLTSLLERQIATSPDAVALSDDRGTMTYAELEARSAALAQRLAGLGARPGSFVAVCMERTRDLVVALIATLRSGAAYVPIDPTYPAARIGFMLDDTRAPILLTDRVTLRSLPELRVAPSEAPRTLVVIDDPVDGAPAPAHIDAARPDDIAYVIYTSGSTGRPKGVLIEHRNVVAFIDWARSVFTPAELRGVLASTSVCFDLSIFELFVPLTSGGAVVLVRDVLALGSPTGAPATIPVTLVNTVPSAIAELLQSRSIPATVTTVNLAGELLPQATVDALYAIPTIERVYDLYGPSEDTTYSTFTLRRPGGRPTIGRPIANTRAYVRDRSGAPAPVGIPGELFLAGAGVARGYHDRDELTAERFLRDPFVGERAGSAARMYRTGDLVRWLSTGELEYLGRLDNQVKLRGFRIELGEIDAALATLPSVVRAVTMVRDLGGDPALVSFLVMTDGTRIDAATVRASLAGQLPHYMLPSAVVTLDAIPMTANGKADRRALAAIAVEAVSSTEVIGPRTATEEEITRIWTEVLRRDGFGVRHSFFDLGGHSLLAMRIVSRIDERFGTRLPLGAVLEHPTIEALATHVDANVHGAPSPVPELRRASRVATRRPVSVNDAPPVQPPSLPELRRDTAAQDLA